eukprot:TRINITY_DN40187_c0_g1_i1.p3 TRINITY_DN40187_c0_g1~~TRINITY_DN40187_c0_g1_i1.p3  ORF type:complete len:117 (+),score=2.17 TRINITY_DN40187_c0_g1_i1:3-353(+)
MSGCNESPIDMLRQYGSSTTAPQNVQLVNSAVPIAVIYPTSPPLYKSLCFSLLDYVGQKYRQFVPLLSLLPVVFHSACNECCNLSTSRRIRTEYRYCGSQKSWKQDMRQHNRMGLQ